jgi:hypothetical protein
MIRYLACASLAASASALLDINFACHDDSECGPGLVCYNNEQYGMRCEDHEAPKIVLNFGNTPKVENEELPPSKTKVPQISDISGARRLASCENRNSEL